MTYVPPTSPPIGTYSDRSIMILQYPNQQIISSNIPFSYRNVNESGPYSINYGYPQNFYYNDGFGGGVWPDFNGIGPVGNDLTENDLVWFGDWLGATVYAITGNAPTTGGYFDSFDSHSIYKYDTTITNDVPQTYPNNQNNWTKVTTLADIGAGAWFAAWIGWWIWDGTQILSEPPVSASLSGSGGFLQVSGSSLTGLPKGRISLMCVATASNDESGGVWMVTDTVIQPGVTTYLY